MVEDSHFVEGSGDAEDTSSSESDDEEKLEEEIIFMDFGDMEIVEDLF